MALRMENVSVRYRALPAVEHIDAVFAEGESWAVVGPNGAGKSTLLKTLMGLEKCSGGRVDWGGAARRDLAYLPQMSGIDRSQPLTVFELAAAGLWYESGFFGGLNRQMRQNVQAALARVGMADYRRRLIGELSDGQFQRVLFARLLAQKARFLLLDEPFNAVDAQTTRALLEILAGCLKKGQGVIAVLHDYTQVRDYFDNALLIARQVVAAGKTEQVLRRENLERAALFRQDTAAGKNGIPFSGGAA